jgi:hypothetical protein
MYPDKIERDISLNFKARQWYLHCDLWNWVKYLL